MPFELQKKFNIKSADTNKKITYFGTTTDFQKGVLFILKFTVCMIHINKEKLLADRERLLNILKSKDLDDQTHRLVREDLRNVEKELEEIDPELFREDIAKIKK